MGDTSLLSSSTPTTDNPGRLKSPDPRELPSFSSAGLPRNDESVASTAAKFGWSRASTNSVNGAALPDPPRGRSRAASTAALLAATQSYRMAHPTSLSAAPGSAARAAVGSAEGPSTSPRPNQGDWGNSAATQAFRSHITSPQAASFPAASAAGGKPTSATSRRPRSASAPIPDRNPSGLARSAGAAAVASSALSAATIAHRPSPSVPRKEPGPGLVVAKVRDTYASTPPVHPDPDEDRATRRHSEAVVMARSIFLQQQRWLDAAASAHAAHAAQIHAAQIHAVETETVASDSVEESYSGKGMTLQEAAYRQAQERLRKLEEELRRARENALDDDDDGDDGIFSAARRFPQLLAHRGPGRRRSSTTGHSLGFGSVFGHGQKTARLPFSDGRSGPHSAEQKRANDALMQLAQRNVAAQMRGMDETVLARTGRPGPLRDGVWEAKALAAAQEKLDLSRADDDRGTWDVGGGLRVSRSDVDATARKRVQPLLDEINQKAAAERERVELLRVEQETKRRESSKLKAQERELKEANRRARGEQRLVKKPAVLDNTAAAAAAAQPGRLSKEGVLGGADESTSPTSKVKNWLRSRLPARREAEPHDDADSRGFIGGKAFQSRMASGTAEVKEGVGDHPRPTTGLPTGQGAAGASQPSPNPDSVSSLSDEGAAAGEVSLIAVESPVTPPGPVRGPAEAGRDSSPVRSSRFREMLS